MEFHFLWIIGFALLCGWIFADSLTPAERKARSWYSVPLIGAVMCVMWLCIQIAQVLS